ncbi:MAG TPA: carboxypeptidase-like regulatory domain-containing protein [Terriglobales bacterium]|nr:carboxypeptidase-like regulatory domain-containing protein [Terriglobales bacterium]
MLQKLGCVVLVLSVVLPVAAAGKPGTISGYVRDGAGVPQMGAVVEVLGAASQTLRVFTDEKGFYSAAGLLPGIYNLRVSAPSFLPVLREGVGLRPGASTVINVTLNTIFEAFQLAPSHGPAEEDDWKWTLRSVANRPVLRVVDNAPTLVTKGEKNEDGSLKGKLSFLAGSGSKGFGSSSDVSTGFSLEHSLFSAGTLAVDGNLGHGAGVPSTVLRTSYAHALPDGSRPEIALTVRRFASPDANLHALQALALSMSDSVTLGGLLELNFGSELQTIEFMGRVNAFRPFGSADLHLSTNTLLEYRYATSVPNSRMAMGFDSAPADLSETNPRVSVAGFSPSLERARHHEISLSRRIGNTNVQVAGFSDRVLNPALVGVGDVTSDSGEVLPDPYSGTFTYQGKALETRGMRAVVQRKLRADLTATLDYSYGGVLDLDRSERDLQDARAGLHTATRQAVAVKLSGGVPHAKTHWITSYRWTNGQALTPVDLFNVSPGQADPYLNVFIRQPIPRVGFLPGRMEALIEIRNLLAQGYVPVLGLDGRTVYLVQSARSVRGGVAFTF